MIKEAVKSLHPDVEIYDPFDLFPDSVTYDNARAKRTLLEITDEAAASDILIAYLPEASMGTAMEMLRAYDNGVPIICISSLEKNWFIIAVASKIFSTLDDFCDWVQRTNLSGLTHGG